jgi:hypothetical protein
MPLGSPSSSGITPAAIEPVGGSRIGIAAQDIAEYHGDRVVAQARLYANKSFKAADETLVQGGSVGNPDFYQDFDASMNGDLVRIETGTAFSTTDSDQPDATYDLDLYDDQGEFIGHILARLRILPMPNPTTWDAISEYSKSVPLRNPPTYMSTDMIEERLASMINPTLKANSMQVGSVRLDVDPALMSDPIAVGTNSPLVAALAGVGTLGRVQTDVAPVDPAHPIAVGNNSPLIGPASVSALGRTKLDVAPVDPANPIVVGSNSPLFAPASAAALGRIKTDVAPADPNNPIAVGVNSPRIVKTLALDHANSFAQAISDIGANNVRLVVSAPVTESSDRSLPANIQLDVRPEGLITIASGKTLTVASLLDPGNRQIFAGTGAVRLGRASVPRFNTAWWTGPTSGASITQALNDCLASCLANSGGRVYLPSGTWLTTGNHNIPTATLLEGQSRKSAAGSASEIKLTAASTPLFQLLPGTSEVSLRDLLLNGDNQTNSTGILIQGTAGTDAIFSGLYVQNCTFVTFNDGVYLHGISDWQIRQIFFDRSTIFNFNIRAGLHINTANTNIECDADFYVPVGSLAVMVERCGQLRMSGNEFAGANVSYGANQVEKQTVAGAVTIAGLAQSVVTAAGMIGSPVTVLVPVTTAHNTGPLIAQQFRKALAKDPYVASFFHVIGDDSSADIYLAAIDAAAPDGTLNFTIATGTATGVTPSTTSSTDTAGNGSVSLSEAVIDITGPYGLIGMYNTTDEGFTNTIKHRYANAYDGNLSLISCAVQGRVVMTSYGRLTAVGCVFFPKVIRDGTGGSGSQVVLFGCTVGSHAFISGAWRETEQRAHNISDANGATSSHVVELNAIDRFSFPHNTVQESARYVQTQAAWFWQPTEPWFEILARNTDQILLRLGRADVSGFGDFYYDFYRETATGYLKILANQADPNKLVSMNCGLSLSGRLSNSASIVVTPGPTPAIDAKVSNNFTLTPGEDETISITNMAAGQEITLRVLTSGATSRALTFGAGFKTDQGVLNTGTVTGKYFIVKFWSDGTNVYETRRTGAM